MGTPISPLQEQDRKRLDSIVDQMIANGESEDNIRFVVNDFKDKYGVKKKEPVGIGLENGLPPTGGISTKDWYKADVSEKPFEIPAEEKPPVGSRFRERFRKEEREKINQLPSTSTAKFTASDARVGGDKEFKSPVAVAKAALIGLASVPAQTLQSIGIAAKRLDFFNEYKDKTAEELATYKAGKWIEDSVRDLVGDLTPEEQEDFSVKLAQGVGQMGGFMIGGIGGRVLRMSEGLTTAALGAGVQASSEYNSAIQSGATPDVAAKAFWINAAIGTTESLPIMGAFRKLDKYSGGLATGTLARKLSSTVAGRITNEMAQGFFNEAAQEATQQILSNITAKNTYDKTREIFDGVAESSAIGGIIGSTMTGALSAIREKRMAGNLTQEEDAELKKAEEFAINKIHEATDPNNGIITLSKKEAKPEPNEQEKIQDIQTPTQEKEVSGSPLFKKVIDVIGIPKNETQDEIRRAESVRGLKEEEIMPELVAQSIDAPTGVMNTLNENRELTTDLIAQSSKEDIEAARKKWSKIDSETADENISLLEEGLAKKEVIKPSTVSSSGEVGIEPEEVQRQMKPITDKMAEVEMEVQNNGYKVDYDYDNEIIVTDKNGDIVEPDELPNKVRKLIGEYEKATQRLGEFDQQSFIKSIEESRKRIYGEDAEIVQPKQISQPQPPSTVSGSEIMYHTSREEGLGDFNTKPIFFSSNKEYSEQYGSGKSKEYEVNIQKPFDTSDEQARKIYNEEFIPYAKEKSKGDKRYEPLKEGEKVPFTTADLLYVFLRKSKREGKDFGYDGVIVDEGINGEYSKFPLERSQVKEVQSQPKPPSTVIEQGKEEIKPQINEPTTIPQADTGNKPSDITTKEGIGTPKVTPEPAQKKSVLERPIEEVSIDDILKEMRGETEGLAFKDVSNKDIKDGDTKNIEAYNQRAEKVLKTLYPNAEFKALETTKEYEKATGRKGEAGVLMRGKEGKHQLFLNLEAIKNSKIERTATHEVVHALVSDAMGVKYADLKTKWENLLPKLYNVKGFEIVKEHIQNYSSADRPVEGITDLLANIVHEKIKIEDIPKNLWDEFIALVNRAFEAIGIDYKITPDTFNGFATSVKEAFETGNFKNLEKFTSKGKTEKFFKQYPEFAEATAMVDPVKRKQLEDLLRKKVDAEIKSGKLTEQEAKKIFDQAGIEPPKGTGKETIEGEEGLPERRFTKRVLRDEDILEETKEGVAETLNYVRQTHKMSVSESNDIINKVGVDEAQTFVMADKDVKGAVRVTLGQVLIRKYNELSKNADNEPERLHYLDKAIQTATYVTEKLATEPGQMIEAFKMWSQLSPEGQLRSANQDMAKQAKEKMRRREKDVKVIAEKFKKANEEAAEEVTKDKSVQEVTRKDENVKISKAQEKIKKAREKRQDIIKKYKGGKGKNLFSSPFGLTPEGIEFVGDIAKTYIEEGVANLEILVQKILIHLEDAAGKKPTDEIIKQVNEIADKQFDKADKSFLGKALKDKNLQIGKIVKEHYTVLGKAKRSLAQKFMGEAGMEQSNAKELASKVEVAFDRIATRKKRNILYNEKARFDKIQRTFQTDKKAEPKTIQSEIIKFSNLGAFENTEMLDMLADRFGLKTLTKEQAAKLMELAEKVQKAPEGSPKNDATEDLLSYRANIRGNDWGETAQAVWYANILSGYRTHEKNVVSTFFNSWAELGAEMIKDPKAIPYIIGGYIKGVSKRGLVEARHTFMTGRSPIHIKKIETPSTLERKKFSFLGLSGGWNPANWFKYVTRLMVAEDVISFQGLKEARAYQLARREAAKSGVNTWTRKGWDMVNEKLFHTRERWLTAQDQAESEGLKPKTLEWRRRIYELMEDSRPEEMTEDAYGFAAHGTFNYESTGTLGAFTNAVGKALDVDVAGVKPARFIVAFTRIITNIVNNSLDFTPVGLIRAARGVRGFRTFEEGQYTKGAFKELTREERQRLVAKAAIGITMAATLQALHVAGVLTITGGGPDDKKKKQQLKEQGWEEYSIKIGDKWYSYKYTPMVFMLGWMGNWNDAAKYNDEDEKTTLKKSQMALLRMGNQVVDMTWINSAGTFLGALADGTLNEQGKKVNDALAGMSRGFIPFSQAVTQTTTLYENIFNQPAKQVNGAWQALIQDIPIARNSLNDKINALGQPVKKDIDVFYSNVNPDPIWKLLDEKQGWVATLSKSSIFVFDQKVNMDRPITDDEFYELSKLRGAKIYNDIKKMVDVGFPIIRNKRTILVDEEDITSKEFNEVLSKIESQATKEAKEELFGEKTIDKKEQGIKRKWNEKINSIILNK